jgi:hypothetical protein
MASMFNLSAEAVLLNRVTALETAKIVNESRLTKAEADIAALKLLLNPPAPLIINRDMSTLDLSQWTHRDYGLGTDIGGNASGAGKLIYHDNVLGRRAAGLTATPTSQASPAAGSDSVYLWDPIQAWGVQGQEWWLRTSFLFPSPVNVNIPLGEAAYQPTTGEFNWLLEFHNGDPAPGPSEIVFGMLTDYPVTVLPGLNPRLRMRLATGAKSSPMFIYKEAPPLLYDHWYEFLVHVKLDTVAGILEWFLDGVAIYSNLSVQTLFSFPSGPDKVSLTVCNYRLHAIWPATIFLGPLCITKDKASAIAAF